jgi:hypothetical protein
MPAPFEEVPPDAAPWYAVAPTAIARPERRATWIARLAGVAAAAVVGLAALGSFIEDLPGPDPTIGPAISFDVGLAEATPARSSPGPGRVDPPAPTFPPGAEPTALPVVALGSGPPLGAPVPLVDRTVTLLDPATGLRSVDQFAPGPDGEVFLDPAGRLVCVCVEASTGGPPAEVAVRIGRLDPATGSRGLGPRAIELRADPGARPGGRDSTTRIGAALSPDGRRVHLAVVRLDRGRWVLEHHVLDVTGGRLLASTPLAAYPVRPEEGPAIELISHRGPSAAAVTGASATTTAASTTAERIVDRPVVRVTPDGALARIALTTREASDGPARDWPAHDDAWAIELDGDGLPLTPVAIGSQRLGPGALCTWEGFATPDRYVRYCETTFVTSPTHASLVIESPAGLDVHHVSLSFLRAPGWDAPLVDVASGRIFVWSPSRHVAVRVDAVTGASQSVELAAIADRPSTGGPMLPRPDLADVPPSWRWLGTSEDRAGSSIAGSADGSLLFAIGGVAADGRSSGRSIAGSSSTGSSSGIWVLDADSLAVIERWTPATAYGSISTGADGRHVLAVGAEGVDALGRSVDWRASLVAHDAGPGGAIAAVYGDVARGAPLRLLLPGP